MALVEGRATGEEDGEERERLRFGIKSLTKFSRGFVGKRRRFPKKQNYFPSPHPQNPTYTKHLPFKTPNPNKNSILKRNTYPDKPSPTPLISQRKNLNLHNTDHERNPFRHGFSQTKYSKNRERGAREMRS